jgi:hypothetical protein
MAGGVFNSLAGEVGVEAVTNERGFVNSVNWVVERMSRGRRGRSEVWRWEKDMAAC